MLTQRPGKSVHGTWMISPNDPQFLDQFGNHSDFPGCHCSVSFSSIILIMAASKDRKVYFPSAL
jgi:3-hydroxymyristoyl/3-hydroxydecanoyl-(acyl carrier protein) dehydratase